MLTNDCIHSPDFGSEFGKPDKIIDKKTLASHIKKGKKYLTIYLKKMKRLDWEPGEIVNTFLFKINSTSRTHSVTTIFSSFNFSIFYTVVKHTLVRTDNNKVEGFMTA